MNIHIRGNFKTLGVDIDLNNIVKKKSKYYINFIIIGVKLGYR